MTNLGLTCSLRYPFLSFGYQGELRKVCALPLGRVVEDWVDAFEEHLAFGLVEFPSDSSSDPKSDSASSSLLASTVVPEEVLACEAAEVVAWPINLRHMSCRRILCAY